MAGGSFDRQRGFAIFRRRNRIFKRGGALTNRMRSKVRNAVKITQPFQRRVIVKDPPIFKADKPFTRIIRYLPESADTSLSVAQLGLAEAAYYGLLTQRWQRVKVKAFKAFGVLPTTATTTQLSIQTPANGTLTAPATFVDYGDGKNRACVSVDMATNEAVYTTGAATVLLSFTAGQISFIDFYVELS